MSFQNEEVEKLGDILDKDNSKTNQITIQKGTRGRSESVHSGSVGKDIKSHLSGWSDDQNKLKVASPPSHIIAKQQLNTMDTNNDNSTLTFRKETVASSNNNSTSLLFSKESVPATVSTPVNNSSALTSSLTTSNSNVSTNTNTTTNTTANNNNNLVSSSTTSVTNNNQISKPSLVITTPDNSQPINKNESTNENNQPKQKKEKPQKQQNNQKPTNDSNANAATTTGGEQKPGESGDNNNQQPQYKGSWIKSTTKAERRAIQEAQKKAKEEAKAGGNPKPSPAVSAASAASKDSSSTPVSTPKSARSQSSTKDSSSSSSAATNKPITPGGKKQQSVAPVTTASVSSTSSTNNDDSKNSKGHPFFLHLPQYEKINSQSLNIGFSKSTDIHPSIIQLGFKYYEGSIYGSNARCIALVEALKEIVKDYHTPLDKAMSRDFDNKLKPQIQFIKKCRPMSISMGNVVKFFKVQIHNLSPELPESEAKAFLIDKLDSFVRERIEIADQLIAEKGATRINNGDTILTYAKSSVVLETLKKAKTDGKVFSVVVVDSNPRFEGKEMLKQLAQAGIDCSYVMLNGVSHMMKDISKVFIGAHTMLSNGNLVSRVGTAIVAMVAHNYNVPVLVCCETYKFCERVQLDAICNNELGDPEAQVNNNAKFNDWKSNPSLKLLNLVYDLTPNQYIDMVLTEIGMVPPSSVPVIIRERGTETN